jgi:hypothetical protein
MLLALESSVKIGGHRLHSWCDRQQFWSQCLVNPKVIDIDDTRFTAPTTAHIEPSPSASLHGHCTSHIAFASAALAQISRDHTTSADLLHCVDHEQIPCS